MNNKTRPLCHVCNTPASFLMSKDGFDEYLCPTCGLSFVFPQPKAEWLKDKVYSYESGYQGNKKRDLSSFPIDKRVETILNSLVNIRPSGKLIDVGCSNGEFMHAARARGFVCSGVEINKRTADIAASNGFEVFQGFLEDASFADKSFDVMYLGDVIEHVNDPRLFIQTCTRIMKADGVIIISTPNMDCFWARSTLWLYQIFGIPWAPATPPHHLFQFSVDNLNRLLSEEGYSSLHSLFMDSPSLRYELGSLHLFGKWKKNPGIGDFLFMIFSFVLYAFLYGVYKIYQLFLNKNFSMVIFYSKR